MKITIIAIVALIACLIASPVLAEGTSGATWTAGHPGVQNWLNTNDIDHDHQYEVDNDLEEYKDPLGVGVDVKIWDFGYDTIAEGVEVQTKYDFNNDEASVFAVLQLDLTRLWEE